MPSWLKVLLNTSFLFLFIIFFGVFFISPVLADWPTYKYNLERSGLSPYGITQKPEVKWTNPDLTITNQPPTVDPEQNIYVPANAKLTKITPSGTLLWTFNTLAPPTSGPSFDSNNNLYFATSGCNPYFYSLTSNGTLNWSYDLRQNQGLCGDYSASTPVAMSRDKTTLYVGVGRPFYGILALDLNGNVKFKTHFSYEIPVGIAIDQNNNLIVTTGRYLYSLSPTGTINWGYPLTGSFNGLGMPIIGPDDNIYLTLSSNYNTNNYLTSYTLSGQRRWTYPTTNLMRLSNPSIKDSTVYFTGENNLFAINSTNGTLAWKWTAPVFVPDFTLTSPIIDKNGLIYSALKDTIYAINPDGTLNWQILLASRLGQPIIPAEETLYIIRQEGFKGFLTSLENTIPNKTPVLFIPGIGGSELKVTEDTNWSKDNGHGGTYTRNYSKDEKIWVNEDEARAIGNDDYFDILRLKSDGQTNEASIEITGELFDGAYKPTLEFFINNGYTLNQDLFIFPYDWRKDISLTKSLLDQKIEAIKQQTGSQKVDLVAHSMGGLVARYYISDPTKSTKINKLITLGTPHLGSVEAIKNIHYGGCLTREFLKRFPFCIGISESEIKDISDNFTSMYELIPTKKYYGFYTGNNYNNPFPFRDDRDLDNNNIKGSLDYFQTRDLLTNLGHNTTLYTPSETFHDLDFSKLNGVETTIIAGSGISTLGQIIERYKINFLGIKIPEKDEIKINGDNTVPLFSASLDDSSRNLSLKSGAKVYYSKQDHGNLPNQGPAMELVKNILSNDSALPAGISTKPFQLNGKQLSVHSPVNIHTYDNLGNHTGPLSNGDFEANIPGSSYNTLDDAKFIFLPDEGVYQIKFEATDQGSFDFKIRDYKDDINNQTLIYKNIPLTQTTTGETTFDTNSTVNPTLLIDEDGDGTAESTINSPTILSPTEEIDNIPPTLTIETNPKTIWPPNGKMIDVIISGDAIDENLESVRFLVEDEYGLVEPKITHFGEIIQFQASRNAEDLDGRTYKIKVIAEDKAGNQSFAETEVLVPHDQR